MTAIEPRPRPARPTQVRGAPAYAVDLDGRRQANYVRLMVLHAVIGAVIYFVPAAAALYALIVAVVIARLCLTTTRPDTLVNAIGYLMATEVLWRMSRARIPWEYSKYLIVVVSICGLVRLCKGPVSALPLGYLIVLVPSTAITLTSMTLSGSRDALVSNLLGPVTLACVALFCTRMVASQAAIARLLWTVVIGTIPMATFMLLTLVSTHNLRFSDNSNFATSGNFGPNEVATALSIALLAIYLLLAVGGGRRYRPVLLAIGAWFLIACLLTFSRGGLLSFGAAAAVATALIMSDVRRFLLTVIAVAALAAVVFGLVIPRLDNFTGGQLSRRFTDTSSAHRSAIAEADWEVFLHHPLLGVGVGLSPEARTTGDAAGRQAHVEYSRLISEHGIFGVADILLLLAMFVRAIRRNHAVLARVWSASLMTWTLTTMAHNDMRLAAVGAAFGLGCLTLDLGTRERGGAAAPAQPDSAVRPATNYDLSP